MHKSRRSFFYTLLLVAGLALPLLFSCSQGLLSFSHQPSSPRIEQLAIDTTMTPKARQLFYKQDPKIQPKAEFRSLCRKPGQDPEKTVILGCFTSNGYRGNIVIQSVTDPRLEGTMEVVAAHEMLHAAYQKLNPLERTGLEAKLKQAAKRVTDHNLQPILNAYASGDPKVYFNELHSYLGTELEDLGDPELEKYYQKYFIDRNQVITLAKRSRKELTKLETLADQLKPQIEALRRRLQAQKQAIQNGNRALDAQSRNLDRMKAELRAFRQEAEALVRRGDFQLVNQFNREQERFHAAARNYNVRIEDHRQQLAQYNQDVKTYNQKITEYNQLAQTRDSILGALKGDATELTVPQSSP